MTLLVKEQPSQLIKHRLLRLRCLSESHYHSPSHTLNVSHFVLHKEPLTHVGLRL